MNQLKNNKSSSKQWLQTLKEESWEAELLVSAIAIFGTFKLLFLVDWTTNKFIDFLYPNQYLIGYIIVFCSLFAISILASMFIIHFFLRAYWIGLVGLNSVFPDYSIEDSAYSKVYTEKIISILPKLKNSIENVDELCSVIFSSAFTFLLMYMYLGIISSLYIYFYNILSEYIPSIVLLIPLIFFLVLLTFQTLLFFYANLKRNKEKNKIQIFLFKIIRLVSILMYGPLYKSILQVSMIFSSNFKKKKRLSYLMLIFLCSGSFVAVYQIKQTNIPYLINYKQYFSPTSLQSNFYQVNNNNNSYLLNPEIPSDIIDKEVIKIFIPIYTHENKKRKEICNHEKEGITELEKNNQLLKCYKEYINIKINNQVQQIDFLNYKHPRTKQFGIVGYLDLKHLNKRKNNLIIEKEAGFTWSIPFYYTLL